MRRYPNLIVIFIILFLGVSFLPGFSQSEESIDPLPEPTLSQQGDDATKGEKLEDPSSRPFMKLQDIESGKKEPSEMKSLDPSDPRKAGVPKVPEKKPNWFERTFWLTFKSWINERNRNDPTDNHRFEEKK